MRNLIFFTTVFLCFVSLQSFTNNNRWINVPQQEIKIVEGLYMTSLLTNTLSLDCDDINLSNVGWESLASGFYPTSSSGVFAESLSIDLALNVNESVIDPITNQSLLINNLLISEIQGLPNGLSAEFNNDILYPISQECITIYGTPFETGIFIINFIGTVSVNVLGNIIEGGVSFTHVLEIGDNPNPISGCTYPGSDNYLLYAMVDDGSCVISGCTDPEASNFHPIFNLENGSCQYVEDISDCIEDLDQDGTIGTPDLLQLLSAFGQTCD